MDGDPNASRQPAIIGVASMLLFLSTTAVIARLIFRRTTGLGFWYDDYSIVVALVMSWVSPICNLVGLRYGLGRHADALEPDLIVAYLKVLYAFEVIWTLTVPVIKLSLLLLFNRIFPVRRVRIATYAVGFFVLTWMLWAGIATIAQCVPIESFWNQDVPGHCINNDAFYIAAGAVNVFTDFAIIAIPIPIIWNLQKISLAQKLGFVAVFTLGGWVCIISIIRLIYIGRISPTDITWTDAWGGLWSSLEVSLDVVAACLPVVAPGVYKLARSGSLSWSHLRSTMLGTRSSKTRLDDDNNHNNHNNHNNTKLDDWKHGGSDNRSMERMVDPERQDGARAVVLKGLSPAPSGMGVEDLELSGKAVVGAGDEV